MRKIAAALFAVAITNGLVIAPPSLAARKGNIVGTGGLGCGTYLEHRAKQNEVQEALYAQWVDGFLSSYNLFATDPQVEIPDIPTILAYVDKFCRDNPLDNVAGAALQLIGDKGGWRAQPRRPAAKR